MNHAQYRAAQMKKKAVNSLLSDQDLSRPENLACEGAGQDIPRRIERPTQAVGHILVRQPRHPVIASVRAGARLVAVVCVRTWAGGRLAVMPQECAVGRHIQWVPFCNVLPQFLATLAHPVVSRPPVGVAVLLLCGGEFFLQSCGEPVHKGGGLRMQFHLVSFPHENPTQEDTAWSPVPQVIPESQYFSRVLNELETAGLIQVDKRDIRIPDTARLANHQPL